MKPSISAQMLRIVAVLTIIVGLWIVYVARIAAAPANQEGDIAVISSPTSNAVVQGTVPITGSADHSAFQFYVIDLAPEPSAGDQWVTIGTTHDVPVINGQLETWDTTLFPDGSYTLRLRVVRLDGNYSEFFAQQVVISNSQPIPTDTPDAAEATPGAPTVTPTSLPPTPTIVVEQPIVDTPTPRPVPTSPPLADPEESDSSFIPTVTGFSLAPLGDSCLYGAGIMLSIFLLFGFLSALKMFVQGFIDRIRGR